MKQVTKSSSQNPKKPWRTLAISLFALIALAFIIWKIIIPTALPGLLPNHAEEAGKPLETALNKVGAIKKCSNGSNGYGVNDEPWYSAMYEIPAKYDDATKIVIEAAKAGGYDLKDDSSRAAAGDNKLLADRASKVSSYTDLESGNVVLLATIFGGKTYDGESSYSCGVKPADGSLGNITTIDFTINLPAFKR